jgi:hypothetical protein
MWSASMCVTTSNSNSRSTSGNARTAAFTEVQHPSRPPSIIIRFGASGAPQVSIRQSPSRAGEGLQFKHGSQSYPG